MKRMARAEATLPHASVGGVIGSAVAGGRHRWYAEVDASQSRDKLRKALKENAIPRDPKPE